MPALQPPAGTPRSGQPGCWGTTEPSRLQAMPPCGRGRSLLDGEHQGL